MAVRGLTLHRMQTLQNGWIWNAFPSSSLLRQWLHSLSLVKEEKTHAKFRFFLFFLDLFSFVFFRLLGLLFFPSFLGGKNMSVLEGFGVEEKGVFLWHGSCCMWAAAGGRLKYMKKKIKGERKWGNNGGLSRE
jgi:hypothetical protein